MNPSKVSANRYALLDELPGLDLISVMCYHGLWDVVSPFGCSCHGIPGCPAICGSRGRSWVFILLSGFCLPMGHHPYKRGALVFGAGALVTAVTVLFMPEDVVLFGVLTLLGSAMGITALLEKALRKIPPAVGAVVSVALFGLTYHAQLGYLGFGDGWVLLPRFLYQNLFTAYLGFYPGGGVLLHRLLPAGALAVSVLVRLLPVPPGRAGADGAAAPFHLPERWGGWGGTRWWCTCCISRCCMECSILGSICCGKLTQTILQKCLDRGHWLWYPIRG